MNRSALRLAATALSALTLTCAVAAASAQTPAALGQVFTCVGPGGRTLTSDRLIGECMDREQRVLSRDGTLIRIVPPQLTADERAAKEERDRRAALERQARVEAVRRDRLLLQRYPNEAEHQKARQSALEDVQASMKLSQQRLMDLERERKPLLQEAEFYKGKQLPTQLKQQLDANEAAVAAQRDAQANQQAELERIDKRYDGELAQLKRLWAGAEPGSSLVLAEPGKPARPASTRAR
jgi:hypothetical protein